MATVVDTVILHYFLLAEELDLLTTLLERPIVVPRTVFDPDAQDAPDLAASELTRNVRYEERLAEAPSTHEAQRGLAKRNAERLRALADYVDQGAVEVVDMTDAEWHIFGRLTTSPVDPTLGLVLPLGAGEAACIAVALERGYVLATDDSDGLRALEELAPDHRYERIRRLLRRAAGEGHISPQRANELHDLMRQFGFRDFEPPFP